MSAQRFEDSMVSKEAGDLDGKSERSLVDVVSNSETVMVALIGGRERISLLLRWRCCWLERLVDSDRAALLTL